MSLDINYIANLANITLNEDEKQSVQEKMEGIIHFVEKIKELELSEYEPSVSSYHMQTVLREDTVGETIDSNNLLLNTPKIDNNSIIVPQVLQK